MVRRGVFQPPPTQSHLKGTLSLPPELVTASVLSTLPWKEERKKDTMGCEVLETPFYCMKFTGITCNARKLSTRKCVAHLLPNSPVDTHQSTSRVGDWGSRPSLAWGTLNLYFPLSIKGLNYQAKDYPKVMASSSPPAESGFLGRLECKRVLGLGGDALRRSMTWQPHEVWTEALSKDSMVLLFKELTWEKEILSFVSCSSTSFGLYLDTVSCQMEAGTKTHVFLSGG